MAHSHTTPHHGCFGCKVASIGFQGLQSREGADPVQTVPVIADDGNRAGQVTGQHKVHWDGRQDATAYAPALTLTTHTRES